MVDIRAMPFFWVKHRSDYLWNNWMRYKMYYWFDELIMWSSTISQKIYSSNQFIEASSKWAARRSLPLLPNTTQNFFAIFDVFFSLFFFCLFVFFCSAYQIKNSFPSFLTLLIFLTYYIFLIRPNTAETRAPFTFFAV